MLWSWEEAQDDGWVFVGIIEADSEGVAKDIARREYSKNVPKEDIELFIENDRFVEIKKVYK
jgi:hypothetical protein